MLQRRWHCPVPSLERTLCTLLPSHPDQTADPNLQACSRPCTSDIICGKLISFRDTTQIKLSCNFLLWDRFVFHIPSLHQIITELVPVVLHVYNHRSDPAETVSLQRLGRDAGHCSNKKDLPQDEDFQSSFDLFSLELT